MKNNSLFTIIFLFIALNTMSYTYPSHSIDNFFLKTEIPKYNYEYGEAIEYKVKLYFRENILRSYKILENRSFDNFTIKNLNNNNSTNIFTEYYNGIKYNVITIIDCLLYPKTIGKFYINSPVVLLNLDTKFSSKRISENKQILLEILPSSDYDYEKYSTGTKGTLNISLTINNYKIKQPLYSDIEVSVELSGKISNNIYKEPTLKNDDWVIIQKPEIIKNKNHRKGKNYINKIYNYKLRAVKTGVHYIGPFEYSYYNTETNKYETISTDKRVVRIINPPVETQRHQYFIRRSTNKDNYYVGEPIIYNIYLYYKNNIVNYNVNLNSNLSQFSIIDYIISDIDDYSIKIYDNTEYKVVKLKKYIISTNTPGMYYLNSPKILLNVPEKLSGLSVYDKNPLSIKVMPVDYDAPVGDFNIKFEIDNYEELFRTDDVISGTVTVYGYGNVSDISNPTLLNSDFFIMSNPLISDTVILKQDKLYFEKYFYYTFKLNKEGTFNLGPFELTFFNVDNNEVDTILSETYQIYIRDINLRLLFILIAIIILIIIFIIFKILRFMVSFIYENFNNSNHKNTDLSDYKYNKIIEIDENED